MNIDSNDDDEGTQISRRPAFGFHVRRLQAGVRLGTAVIFDLLVQGGRAGKQDRGRIWVAGLLSEFHKAGGLAAQIIPTGH